MGTRVRGKRHRADAEKVTDKPLSVADAIKVLRSFKPVKFDPMVELVVWLGIAPKQADQAVRGAIALPHGIGKSKRVVAFCEGEAVTAAKAAGAIEAGLDDLVKKVQDGWTDFDVAVATPNVMRVVSRLGRILGPTGKMPSPKAGTVVDDIATAVREYSAGKIEYRNDDGGNVHVPVGKLSFDDTRLIENIEAFLTRLRQAKPATSKGTYFKRTTLKTTMSPGVAVDVQ